MKKAAFIAKKLVEAEEIGKAMPAIKRLEGARKKKEPAVAKKNLVEEIEIKKLIIATKNQVRKRKKIEQASETVWLLFCSDCWQIFTLATACFKHYFFFFNCILFCQEFFLSLFSVLPKAITCLILSLLLKSTSVHFSQSFFSKLYLALRKSTSNSIIGYNKANLIIMIELKCSA